MRIKNLDFLGGNAKFDHIGIAVSSIDGVLKNTKKTEDPIQKVYIAFTKLCNFKLELVEPLGESSPVSNIIKKGQSLYHICFKVKDMQAAITAARKNGFNCIASPVPAVAFNNKKIAWLFSRTFGLIELLEK